jgi:hypothetical protein
MSKVATSAVWGMFERSHHGLGLKFGYTRHWKDHFKSDLRSDQDHRLKKDLRSDQDQFFNDQRSFFASKVPFLSNFIKKIALLNFFLF